MKYKECKLGDVADVISGYAFKTNDFVEAGVGVIKIKNITPPNISNDDMQYATEDLAENLEKYKVRFNDVLISMTGSNVNQFASAVGKVGRLRDKNNYYILNQRVGKIVIKDSNLYNYDFLYHFLTQTSVRWELASSAGGSANQANISPKQIKEVSVPLPDIDIQNGIANILNSIDDKIELNNKINENLQSLSQLLFKQWFVDFEFPNEEGLPYKSSGGEMVDSELGVIPKGWEVGILGDIIEISSGKRPQKKSSELSGKFVIPLAGASSIMGYVEEYNYSEPILVIGRVGTHGIIQRFNSKVWASDNTLVIKSIYYEYTNQILARIDYNSLNRGSTQPLITQTDIKNQKFIKPSKDTLISFEELVSSLYNLVDNNLIENYNLTNLRDTLLPKLMNGEIDLDNLEINQKK